MESYLFKMLQNLRHRPRKFEFFVEDSGLKHHFRTMHRGIVLDDKILGQCKKIFRELHWAEMAEVIKKLSAIRLQEQVHLFYSCIAYTIYLNIYIKP